MNANESIVYYMTLKKSAMFHKDSVSAKSVAMDSMSISATLPGTSAQQIS